jgi:formamidopyrimidine-DNA glycosylase
MSGSFRVDHETPGDFHHPRSKDTKHDHIVFHLQGGKTITYNDPRRFGFMDLDATAALDANRHLKNLGAEPLSAEFDGLLLATLFGGSNAPLKTALLDQRRLVGLGNIYVCEALWRAGLLPTRPAGALADSHGRSTRAANAMAPAIKSVLEEAIVAGGSTLRDHRQADGTLGYFQHSFAVYGREGLPCLKPRCPGIIRRATHAGRSTFWCPLCQK